MPPLLGNQRAQVTSCLPGWMSWDTGEEGAGKAVPSPVGEQEPTPGAESGAEGKEPLAEQAEVPAWMQDLLIEQGPDEETISEPEEAIELPPWLQDTEPFESPKPVPDVQLVVGEEAAAEETAGWNG